MATAPDFEVLMKLDFTLLKAQKSVLINLQAKKTITKPEWDTLEGMINLIDHIQDTAVAKAIVTEEEAFNLSGEDEQPKMSLKEAQKIVSNPNL